ncbi:MAG: GGDEF domain-containing protein [Gammaproteobacteria bacterium]|nr:GGDEF domain-containing protein [Gammaproteobacteria bacterium]
MNINAYICNFIRHHGKLRTVVAGTLLLVLLVAMLTIVAELVLFQALRSEPVYYAVLITFLSGPLILYLFVNLISQLEQSEGKLLALSIMDDLTDVYNRRYFLEQTEKELAKAQRYGTIFSILVVDVDHLKRVNETFGHSAGDAVLQSLANTCMNNLRTMDIFARLGGEEFAFLIPESDKTNVVAFAKKVLDAMEDTVVVFDHQEIHFTVSIGVKAFDDATQSLDAMLKDADDALEEAKRRGRNCIVVCDAAEQVPAE